MGSPLDKSRVISMFFVKKREGVVDNQVDERVFNGRSMGVDPHIHFFCELTELVIDNGAMSGFDVLATQEKNGAKVFFGDWDTAFFEATKANFVCGWVSGVIKTVSKKGGKGRDSRGKKLEVFIFSQEE